MSPHTARIRALYSATPWKAEEVEMNRLRESNTDLLEALELAIHDGCFDDFPNAEAAVSAAIAKAKGGQP